MRCEQTVTVITWNELVLECLHAIQAADMNVLCHIEYVTFYLCQNVSFSWALVYSIVYLSETGKYPRGRIVKFVFAAFGMYPKNPIKLTVNPPNSPLNPPSKLGTIVNNLWFRGFPLEINNAEDSGIPVKCPVFISSLVCWVLKMNRTRLVLRSYIQLHVNITNLRMVTKSVILRHHLRKILCSSFMNRIRAWLNGLRINYK